MKWTKADQRRHAKEQALAALEARHGFVTPELVVEAARPDSSPLHRYFEWDDTVAARMHRLEQARLLLRAVVVESPAREGETVRAYLVVNENDDDVYVGTMRAMSEEVMRQQVLERAKAELRAFRAKYAQLKELADLMAAISEVA